MLRGIGAIASGLDSVAFQSLCPLLSMPMKKDASQPATKTDIAALSEELRMGFAGLRKEIADFQKEVDQQFSFVADKLTETLNRLDTIEAQLQGERQGLLNVVRTFVGEHHAAVNDHARRLERLERHVGIDA